MSVMRPLLPTLAIRVGVTGTRDIPAGQEEHIRRQVHHVLHAVKAEMVGFAMNHEKNQVYARDQKGAVRPLPRLISPLAEGADRLVADVAVALGYQLEVAMPFPLAAYRADFKTPESLAEFERLLLHASEGAPDGGARVLALDGLHSARPDDPAPEARDEDAPAAYAAVGRLVVRNCDLLIGIWDGHGGERGGTAETIRFAARSGPPVWWIDPAGQRGAVWVETMAQLRRPASLQPGDADGKLADYLVSILQPPPPKQPAGEGVFGRLFRVDEPPLPRFLGECLRPDIGWTKWLWSVEKRVMKLAGAMGFCIEKWLEACEAQIRRAAAKLGLKAAHPHAPETAGGTCRGKLRHLFFGDVRLDEDRQYKAGTPGTEAPFNYWGRFYTAPDALALAYANRYRSSYVLVTLSASLALLAAAGHAIWHGGGVPLGLIEVLSLALLFVIVMQNHRKRWHERWISYRLLAELCRSQRALATLAWSLPLGETWRVARGEQGATQGRIGAGISRDAWVGWYFHAALRAAPLPTGTLSGACLHAVVQAAKTWLFKGQIAYHSSRAHSAREQVRGLAGWGEVLLGLTFLAIIAKAILLILDGHETAATVFEIMAQILVVPAGAFVALRIYAELELLAESCSAMASMLANAQKRIDTLVDGLAENPSPGLIPPLISQEVSAAIYDVVLDMLSETEGWARLFKGKIVEVA